MANTFTQIYIHIVFAVQGRVSLIRRAWKDQLEGYITGIVKNLGHKLITINSRPDHIHILIGLNPKEALSDFVRQVKASSSKHANEQHWRMGRFQWQEGYGAFSVSRSVLKNVINYIELQDEHHEGRTFRHEFRGLLDKYDVKYNEAYLFDDIDPEAFCGERKQACVAPTELRS